MVLEMMQRRGMGYAGQPGALPQGHGIRALGSDQLIHGVEKSLAQFAVMVFFRHL
jgi:hypothetical protein